MSETSTRTRLKVLGVLVVFMFSGLTTRLWFLQVLASPKFANLAKDNQVRLVPIEPVRGEILDRRGNVLVGNRATTVVLVDRRELGSQEEDVLYRLAQLLHLQVSDILSKLNSLKYLPYQPVPIAGDVPKETIFYIEEHPRDFPGVSFEVDPVREYPDGSLAAQVLGYVLPISSTQLAEPAFTNYQPGDLVGDAGVEAAYEQYLRGHVGYQEIQVNAAGKVLNPDFGTEGAKSGDNVVLSIDQRIQDLAQSSLDLGIQLARHTADRTSGKFLRATGGAVVVMDPNTGQVVAMASYPTYDPSVILDGLSQAEYDRLNAPSSNEPLLNRATQGLYPAGSTFKPFVAAGALAERIAKTDGKYDCPAAYYAPNDASHHAFNNWSPFSLGAISLPTALAISCDTVFYQFGYDYWLKYNHSNGKNEAFQHDLGAMGFGKRTGIDLPGEQSGIIPDYNYEWDLFQRNPGLFNGRFRGWLPGDSINLAIGQGFIQVTPLQLAAAYSAIANGGTLYAPHVGWKIESQDGTVVKTIAPEVMGTFPIPKNEVLFIRNALNGVTLYGTASTAFAGFPLGRIPVAGKTGTADIIPKQPTSWFAAMAPSNAPRYVVIAMVEQGGHGATTAAPIVRRILEGLFGLTTGGLSAGQVAD